MPPRPNAILKLLGAAVALCGVLNAQTRKVETLAAGKLLVMDRQALDPVFAESVVLLIHYDQDGVVGIRLNQPSSLPLSRLRELKGTGNRTDPLYLGGPVEKQSVMALVRTDKAPANSIHVAGDVYAVQTRQALQSTLKASKGPADFRIYLGYCGWVIPQLKNEVTAGAWHIFDHGERFAFDSTPATLWDRLIDKAEVNVAFARWR